MAVMRGPVMGEPPLDPVPFTVGRVLDLIMLDPVPPTASRVLDLIMLPLEGDRTIHEIVGELELLEHREIYGYIEHFRERGLGEAT